MPEPRRLRDRDLHGIVAVAMEAAASDGTQPFGRDVIDTLARLVPSDQAGYYEARIRSGHNRSGRYQRERLYYVKQPGIDIPWDDEILAAWWDYPANDHRNRRRTRALRLSDCWRTAAARRRNSWRQLVMRPSGIAHALHLWLPAPSDTVRTFWLVRAQGRADFNERDQLALTMLRVHLSEVRARWEVRHRPPGLTRRESELLELVRLGLTNREIAERLVLSPGTVRKHLENIFEKLDVHTRTAAASSTLSVAELRSGSGHLAE